MTLLVNLHGNFVDGIGCKYHVKVSQRLRLFQVYTQLFQENIGGIQISHFICIQVEQRHVGDRRKSIDSQWLGASDGMCEKSDPLVTVVLSRRRSNFGLHCALCSLQGIVC